MIRKKTPTLLGGGGQNPCQTRNSGLDIIRSFAILFVIAGHFFSLHTAFKTSTFEGISLFIQSTVSFLFYIGVSLFLLLTGYLNTSKSINKKYYRGGIRVIISYLLFSLITIIFRKYYLHEELSWLQWGLKVLDFSAIPYGWYIEMWIGLFLLTPFLNLLYKAIPNRKQKLILIGTLYIMTALPDLLNRYGLHLVPGFWQQCFPLTFYFIGAYIHEYKPTIRKEWAWLIILGICLINPVFNLLFIHNHTLIQICGSSNGVFGVPVAVLFFLLFYQSNIHSVTCKKALAKVSILSLDMYLCCYIFDAIYYPYFKEHYFVNQSQFGIYIFIIVPLVFISSFVMAWSKEHVFKILRLHI
ncbi:acyltransferase [Bacteroides sp.]